MPRHPALLRPLSVAIVATVVLGGTASTGAAPTGASSAGAASTEERPSKGAASKAGGQRAGVVKISGVYFDGVLNGVPEPDSAIRLTSIDKKPVAIGGYALVEQVPGGGGGGKASAGGFDAESDGAGEGSSRGKRGGGRGPRRAALPEGAMLKPGQDVWIAQSAKGFQEVFGFLPDYEAEESNPAVPNVEGTGFPLMPSKKGTVALIDRLGDVADFVAYDAQKDATLTEQDLPDVAWSGGPVILYRSSQYGWKGQVLSRDRDSQGRLLDDTDSAADWDAGFSRKPGLGIDPVHRIELAGQSRFLARRHLGVRAKVKATSAPDNNFAALIGAFQRAKKTLRISVYQLTNPKIAEEIVKARLRGVDVTLWLEGAPVGGIPDGERVLVDRAFRAGVKVYFLAAPPGSAIKPRYRFDHSKYVLVDDDLAIIGTENFGHTGVPVVPSYGNRGWMIHIENKELVAELRAVWDHDFRPGRPDVLSIDASPTDSFGLPLKDPAFKTHDIVERGLYVQPAAPVVVEGTMDLELVLSPDTSLDEDNAIIGLIKRAKKTVYIEQNTVRRKWGFAEDSPEEAPDLPLLAVVEAARRGVAVRVLLDSTWYNVQGDEDKDNDDTVMWLNELARTEGLDISAKVVNLQTTHIEKIHAKGVIVDGKEVFVGSINWSENSFKGNREVGVIVGDAKIAGYYQKLFERDWSLSRIYTAVVDKSGVITAMPDGGKVLGKVQKGDRLTAVGEHGAGEKQMVEVALGMSKTGYIAPALLGTPEATAGEALHLIGRYATVIGRVAATNVSDRRIQLRFEDEKRPPFTAVIFSRNEGLFTAKGLNPTSAFQGRELRLRGRIQQYKGPEILIDIPDQIEIVR